MNPIEIAIIVIVSVAFVAAVTAVVIRKVKHKGCCDDCSSCGGACSHCKPDGKKDDKVDMPEPHCDGRCEHCAQTHIEVDNK